MSSADLGKAFDCTELRKAVALQWSRDGFELKVAKTWKEWELQPSPEEAEKEVGATTSGNKKNQKETSSSSPSSRAGVGANALEALGWRAVEEIKATLAPKPWHDTITLVTYDIPKTAIEARDLTNRFIARQENDGTRAAIYKMVPKMKNQPDTEVFMQQMILPFRSFLLGQVVSLLVEQIETPTVVGRPFGESLSLSATTTPPTDSGADGGNKKKSDGGDDGRKVLAGKKGLSYAPTQKSMIHATSHAKDIADVVFINSLIPDHDRELKQHIDRLSKQDICTRYAKYCYLYMSLDAAATNAQLAEQLHPLASAGLAQAQYDLGLYVLNNKRGDPLTEKLGSGEEWLLRAANLGHTKSMLSLIKYYLVKARNCLASKTMRGKDARIAYKNSRLGALKWYDVLLESEWDEDTVDDISQAKKLNQELRILDDAAPWDIKGTSRSNKFGGVYRNWGKVLLAIFVIVTAFVVLTAPSPNKGDEVDGPTHTPKSRRPTKWD